jgi:hypothetical protein
VYQQLTKYLSQYKQVSIPQVGTFELVPQSATLDVASKLIHPPSYATRYTDSVSVKEHQLNFLALDLNAGRDQALEELENFGRELKKKLQGGVFSWKDIGRLEAKETITVFHPEVFVSEGLKPIAAEKVLRKNVQHAVLRGEQEVFSASFYDEEKIFIKKVHVPTLMGWIAVALSALLILYFVYRNNFSATSSGTRMKVSPAKESPTYK